MALDAGQKVVATRDLGGFFGPHVPRGSKGVVTQSSGVFSRARAQFTVTHFFSADEQVEIDIDDGDVG